MDAQRLRPVLSPSGTAVSGVTGMGNPMHQRVELLPGSADRRNAFEFFYAGWKDFLEEQPPRTSQVWRPAEVGWYEAGYKCAQRALADMQA